MGLRRGLTRVASRVLPQFGGVVGAVGLIGAGITLPGRLAAQEAAPIRENGDSVSIHFVDADLRAVIAALGRYLAKPVVVGAIPSVRVSLETPTPVSRQTAGLLLRGIVESNNLQFTDDTTFFRVQPKPAEIGEAGLAAAGARTVNLFVIRLKHARAEDVAATVNQLFGGGGAFAGAPGTASGTLSDELRRSLVPPAGQRSDATDRAQGAPPAGGAARGANLNGPVVILPDALTNSLLVRASRSDFEVIRQAVDQLDIRPLQALIEVLIVEARQDRSFSLGADLKLPTQSIGGDQTMEGTLTGGGLGDVVLRFMQLGKADVDAVLRVAQSRGDVRIVSRPVILASNNMEARLLVGSQRPFVQVSRSLPTDTPTRDQVIQYRDVGTKLTVKPTINQDGYVSLYIQQEINAATSETQFDAPVISTREAETQVLVRDGQTIVIGGLRDHQRDRTSSGIPVLSGIPIIGGLFGGTSRRSTTTELYLFLTPRIIRTDQDADALTAPRLPKEFRVHPEPSDSTGAANAGHAP